jgi:hypothetical protein
MYRLAPMNLSERLRRLRISSGGEFVLSVQKTSLIEQMFLKSLDKSENPGIIVIRAFRFAKR